MWCDCSVDIKAIACGPHHAVAVGLSSEESGEFSEIFTWGRGADGRLGSGNEEDRYAGILYWLLVRNGT